MPEATTHRRNPMGTAGRRPGADTSLEEHAKENKEAKKRRPRRGVKVTELAPYRDGHHNLVRTIGHGPRLEDEPSQLHKNGMETGLNFCAAEEDSGENLAPEVGFGSSVADVHSATTRSLKQNNAQSFGGVNRGSGQAWCSGASASLLFPS